MTDTSARFALPLLEPGQAQKEMCHNEALTAIDLIAQASVVAFGLAAPPADPAPGQSWIVGEPASGAWSGRAGQLAGWTAGGWRFVVPAEGMAAWVIADALTARYVDGDWVLGRETAASLAIDGDQVIGPRRPAIADPAGGTTVDTESRATLLAILATLRGHGLIAT